MSKTRPEPRRYLAIGAHPDDPEMMFGGCAAKLARLGQAVTFVSCTNGDAGHHTMKRRPLAARRRAETQASAKVIGLTDYIVLEHHDGELMPTLENRHEMVRLIRRCAPDVVVTHRLCDYHADHRATAQLVQDASFLLNVPLACPDTPPAKVNPVIMLAWDRFTKPNPFAPDVVVSIDDALDAKLAMIDCHVSQFHEWIPHLQGVTEPVPSEEKKRLRWLMRFLARYRQQAKNLRPLLKKKYGQASGQVTHAESFEVSEYGRQPGPGELEALFPF